jgi:type I restriction enzyme S subunit
MYRITQTDLEEIRLPIPPSAEQRRITHVLEEFLARIDETVEHTVSAARRAAELSSLINARASSGQLSDAAPLAPAALRPATTDDGVLPWLPAGWQWERLGSIADVARGVSVGGTEQWYSADVEVPCLRVSNVQSGRLALDEVAAMRLPADRVAAFRLRPDDVLLTGAGDRNSLGRGWIWEGQLADCVHQNHVFRVRIKDHCLHPKLLAWHANSFGRSWCERNARQSAGLASLGLSVLRLMPVPLGPWAEQERLVALAEQLTAQFEGAAASAERALTIADHLRRAMLLHAFTGRLLTSEQAPENEEDLA